MSRFFLIRHGAHDYLGKVLVGRSGGVHLNGQGKLQAEWLAGELESEPLTALFSSPLERSVETSAPIVSRTGVKCSLAAEFNEVDFGLWSNRSFAILESDPEWIRFNDFRSVTRAPCGESLLQVQQRGVAKIEELRRSMPHSSLAVVSHGDPLRVIIAYFLGIPLDLLGRLEISPGSLSILELTETRVRLELLNATAPAVSSAVASGPLSQRGTPGVMSPA